MQYRKSVDRGEVDLDSDVNHLAQLNYGNPLLYPVIVSDFPRPERGILCISIVDIISKRTLVLFSLLRSINYHYNNGPLKVEFIK